MLSCSIEEHPRQELDRALAEQGLSPPPWPQANPAELGLGRLALSNVRRP